jgi:uncharacterized protein (DUF58 family)
VSTLSGPVPRGLRVSFVVLTAVAVALAAYAGFRGVWLLTVVCGLFAVLNLGVLWTTRAATAADLPDRLSRPDAD